MIKIIKIIKMSKMIKRVQMIMMIKMIKMIHLETTPDQSRQIRKKETTLNKHKNTKHPEGPYKCGKCTN